MSVESDFVEVVCEHKKLVEQVRRSKGQIHNIMRENIQELIDKNLVSVNINWRTVRRRQ